MAMKATIYGAMMSDEPNANEGAVPSADIRKQRRGETTAAALGDRGAELEPPVNEKKRP
jgi:hypothetical protein